MTRAEDILVVDDDADMLESTQIVLEDAGFRTRGATNGREALRAVAEQVPAVVLLDMLMPGMSGEECARLLRERYGRSLPVVIITAAERLAKRATSAGADAVLGKPFEVTELLRIVEQYVHASATKARD